MIEAIKAGILFWIFLCLMTLSYSSRSVQHDMTSIRMSLATISEKVPVTITPSAKIAENKTYILPTTRSLTYQNRTLEQDKICYTRDCWPVDHDNDKGYTLQCDEAVKEPCSQTLDNSRASPTPTAQDLVLDGCRDVCDNADAYDGDMLLVQSCNDILKLYDGHGCLAEDKP